MSCARCEDNVREYCGLTEARTAQMAACGLRGAEAPRGGDEQQGGPGETGVGPRQRCFHKRGRLVRLEVGRRAPSAQLDQAKLQLKRP